MSNFTRNIQRIYQKSKAPLPPATEKKLLLAFAVYTVAFAFLMLQTNAHAECTAPDIYTMGTGVNLSGLCTSISTGQTAAAAASIDASTASIDITTAKAYLMQADQLAAEVIQQQNLVIQTEMMIQDLEENPLQVIMPDANQLIANQKRIDKLAQDIANNSSAVGANLLNDLEHPATIGLGEGSRFALWSDARRQAVTEAYEKAKAYIQSSSKRNQDITTAIKNAAAAQDKTANLKAISNIEGQQLSWLQTISESLTQMMQMQATENGAKVADEMTTAESLQNMADNPPFKTITIPQDSYQGPGQHGSAF